MLRHSLLAIAIATAALAQTPTPASAPASATGEMKAAYTGIKNNLTKMSEKMPEEAYGFKASAEVRTFGELMLHIADSQTRTCSLVNGDPKQPNSAGKTAKADIVAAMKESFTLCDKAFESLTDANSMEAITTPRGSRTRLGALYGIIVHGNEEYGYGSIYLRLKSITPPSSERR